MMPSQMKVTKFSY